MYRKLSHVAFFALLLLFCMAGSIGIAASSTGLEGNWRNLRQKNVDPIFLSFGADDSFYMESKTCWYLGSYTLEDMDETRQLILDVEAGSDTDHIGERFAYSFQLKEDTLIVETSPITGILESQSDNGRAVYIVISNDTDDDDDDEFTIYASCFIDMIHQTDTACCTPSNI